VLEEMVPSQIQLLWRRHQIHRHLVAIPYISMVLVPSQPL
jgi:hypothetical protein